MTICKACGKETVHMFYNIKNGCWLCSDCYIKPPSRIGLNVNVELKNGDSITAAHLDDIMRREAMPDGSVRRKNGRKYI